MPTEEKAQQVLALEEKLRKSAIVVSTEFRGLTVAQVSALRRKLRAEKVEMLVVKNTLASIAAKNVGKGGIGEVLKGPTAIVLGYDDPIGAPKALSGYLKENEIGLKITGGFAEGRVLSTADVESLASTPPRPILMGQVMGGLLAPLYGLLHALNFHVSGLARALEGRRKQLESAAPAAAAAS